MNNKWIKKLLSKKKKKGKLKNCEIDQKPDELKLGSYLPILSIGWRSSLAQAKSLLLGQRKNNEVFADEYSWYDGLQASKAPNSARLLTRTSGSS